MRREVAEHGNRSQDGLARGRRQARVRRRVRARDARPAAVRLPQRQAHLRAGHLRRDRAHAGRGVDAVAALKDELKRTGNRDAAQAGRRRSSRACARSAAFARWSSIAMASSITAASKALAEARAKPVCSSDGGQVRTSMAVGRGRERIESHGVELKEKVVQINRVAKVVKGGRRFSFSALVVVGDGAGASATASARPTRCRRRSARRSKRRRRHWSPSRSSTGPSRSRCMGHFGAGHVLLRPAADGTGVIAGGGVRAVVELGGRAQRADQVHRLEQSAQHGQGDDARRCASCASRRRSPRCAARPSRSCAA